jgi:VWFA-related protein
MRSPLLLTSVIAGALLAGSIVLIAQDGPQDGPVQGSSGSTDSVARPRTKPAQPADDTTDDDSNAPIPSKLKPNNHKDDDNTASFQVEANLVTVDVAVVDNRDRFIPNIPKGNFRVLEDDVPQQIKSFSMGEAPMTVAMLVEFSNKWQRYGGQTWYQTLQAAYGFVQTLKPQDYVAVIAYDMHPEILSDFSQDRRKTEEAMSRLRFPGFSESNLFDALVDTEERMKGIEGRKAILLLSTGVDTFSKLTFDKARKIIQEDAVPVYAIGLMQALRIMSNMSGSQEIGFLQADNEMRTFAKETGGQSFFPRFTGEFPSIYSAIQQSLRNQYTIGYSPTNTARDGKFRKIKVELVNPQGDPLKVSDEKGKPIKYRIICKAGYNAPHTVE